MRRSATRPTSAAPTTAGPTATTAAWSGCPSTATPTAARRGIARKDQSLLPAPAMDIYNGMIFVSLDADVMPLREFLGDFAFYLDYYTRQSEDGIELRGPQRWRIKANWKIGAENFAGDMYHTPHTHASVVEIGLFREPKAEKRKDGTTYWATSGGGTTYKLPPGDFADRPALRRLPRRHGRADGPDLVGGAAARGRRRRVHDLGGHGVPEPQLRAQLARVGESDDVLPFISLRQWQPIAPDETEVLSWFAVDKNAPQEFKELSYKAYLMCFGSSGMFEQDDVENWVSLTSTAAGSMARRLLLNSRMGLWPDDTTVVPPLRPSSGAGRARPTSATASTTSAPCCASGPTASSVRSAAAVTRPDVPDRRRDRAEPALRRPAAPHRAPVARRRGLPARQPGLRDLADAADRRHPLRHARTRDDRPRRGLRHRAGHGPLRRGQVLPGPAGGPVRHRARLDRGPPLAAAPPRRQRAHVRDRRPGRARGAVVGPAVPQPRRRPRGRVRVGRPRRPAARRGRRSGVLARRTIMVDESVLRMQNLAVFL